MNIMLMSAHSNASYESATLCDKLFEELSMSIPNLKRNPTKGSCGLWQTGRTRFAYVYHSKTMSQIEIWCRGDMAELLNNDPGLGVQGRDRARQGWEVSFPVRFRVYQKEQIPLASKYLKENSYRASSLK